MSTLLGTAFHYCTSTSFTRTSPKRHSTEMAYLKILLDVMLLMFVFQAIGTAARPTVHYLNLTSDNSTAVDLHNDIIVVSIKNVPEQVCGRINSETGEFQLTALYKATAAKNAEVTAPIEMNQMEAAPEAKSSGGEAGCALGKTAKDAAKPADEMKPMLNATDSGVGIHSAEIHATDKSLGTEIPTIATENPPATGLNSTVTTAPTPKPETPVFNVPGETTKIAAHEGNVKEVNAADPIVESSIPANVTETIGDRKDALNPATEIRPTSEPPEIIVHSQNISQTPAITPLELTTPNTTVAPTSEMPESAEPSPSTTTPTVIVSFAETDEDLWGPGTEPV